jgi:hypothetical protein
VTIAFRAIDSDGRPVVDLKPEDVTLRIDGRKCEIRALQLVQSRRLEDGEPSAPIPPPFATNATSDAGRDVWLVLDDESILPGREQSFRKAVERLLAGLSSADRVGFEVVRNAGTRVGLTNQHDRVLAAVAAARGRATEAETGDEALCRTRVVLNTLADAFQRVSGSPPASMVFFSSSLRAPDESAARMASSSGMCEVRLQDFQDMTAVARATPADFYVVHVTDGLLGLTTASRLPSPAGAELGESLMTTAGLQSLAGAADGELIRVAGDDASGMAQVLRETAAFYQVTFGVPSPARGGAPHRIDVRVDRKSVKIRAQQVLPTWDVALSAQAKAPPAREMLRLPRVYRDVVLRSAVYASRVPGGDARTKLTVLFEPVDRATTLTAAEVGLFDRKGKLAARWIAEGGDFARAPMMAALVAAPGDYRLRLVARDEGGRGGTVEDEIRVDVGQAGPLRLSGLVLGAPHGRSFSPALQFRTEAAAVGYLEVYGAPKAASVSVIFEIVAANSGPALASAPATVTVAADADDFRFAVGTIPIASLPPGDFLVRATVRLDGRVVGRADRTLRKTDR